MRTLWLLLTILLHVPMHWKNALTQRGHLCNTRTVFTLLPQKEVDSHQMASGQRSIWILNKEIKRQKMVDGPSMTAVVLQETFYSVTTSWILPPSPPNKPWLLPITEHASPAFSWLLWAADKLLMPCFMCVSQSQCHSCVGKYLYLWAIFISKYMKGRRQVPESLEAGESEGEFQTLLKLNNINFPSLCSQPSSKNGQAKGWQSL